MDGIFDSTGNLDKLDWSTGTQIEKLHSSSLRKDQELILPDTQEEGLKLLSELIRTQICRIKESGSYGQTEYAYYSGAMLGLYVDRSKYL